MTALTFSKPCNSLSTCSSCQKSKGRFRVALAGHPLLTTFMTLRSSEPVLVCAKCRTQMKRIWTEFGGSE